MRARALLGLFTLAVLAAGIWLRELPGKDTADSVLPLLAAFPLYIWLGWPWKWSRTAAVCIPRTVIAGIALTLLGVTADSTLLLAAGWVAFLAAFQSAFLANAPSRLLILPFLGFPWVTQNLESLGWLFRYTGAATVQFLFTVLGFTVHREGTLLLIRDMPLSVEPACAGLNVLQSTLLVGALMICMRAPRGRFFWIAFASLVPLAWVANTLRIFVLGCAGLLCGPDFAMGWFHQWGGWLVLCVMFLLCKMALTRIPSGSAEQCRMA